MDPNVALIVGALAAGVAATATQAVKDAYAALKGVLAKRFAGNAKAERALADHAEEPDIYDKAIAKQIEATGAATDAEVLAAAERVKQSAVAAGMQVKYLTNISGGRNVIGDGAVYNEHPIS